MIEYILIIILYVLLFLLIFILIILFNKSKESNLPFNATIAINFNTHQTDSHFVLLEESIKYNYDGRGKVIAIPRDYNRDPKNIDKRIEVKKYKFVLGRGRRVEVGSGGMSRRNIVFYFPKDWKHLPRRINESELGFYITKIIKNENDVDSFMIYLEEIKKLTNKLVKEYPAAPVREYIKRLDNIFQEALKRTEKKDEYKYPSLGMVQ